MKKKTDIGLIGDSAEIKSFVFIKLVVNRLLDGFFHFKKRKGEIVAGSATFFTLLSFGPILLSLISLTSFFFDTKTEAQQYVLKILSENIPNLAPWILTSLEKIISTQLSGEGNFSIINLFVLIYASLGVVTSLYFGLNTISKNSPRGGFLIEDIRSLFTGLGLAAFMGCFLLLNHPNLGAHLVLYTQNEYVDATFAFLMKYNIIHAVLSLGFFTFYYQYSTPRDISLRESFYGATTFVGCLIVGKSFYWVYHLYTKDTMSASYGNFYTLVMAVMWVYYLMCSFFYGASVSCVREKELYQGHLKVDIGIKEKNVNSNKTAELHIPVVPRQRDELESELESFDPIQLDRRREAKKKAS